MKSGESKMSTAIPIPTPNSHISTQERWSLTKYGQEVSLHQYGWSVSTVGGNRYDLPPRRGSNRTYPYRPGAVHQRKLPDQRTISLDMWLTGTKPGTGEVDGDMTLRWNDSWDFIRELVWNFAGDQVILTRRWWRTIGGVATVQKASALVEIADTMPPTMTGRYRSTFTMTFLMADPFFYGDWETHRVNVGSGDSEDPGTDIYNLGQDWAMTQHFQVELVGPLTNPKLRNRNTNPDIWVKYTGNVSGGLTLHVSNFLAIDTAGNNVIRHISHAGHQFWMGLTPGNNNLTLSATEGSGHANVLFRPAYL